jgi:hypothetical protein
MQVKEHMDLFGRWEGGLKISASDQGFYEELKQGKENG